MTRLREVRKHQRRLPPRYSRELHDDLELNVVQFSIINGRVSAELVEALEEALADWRPEEA